MFYLKFIIKNKKETSTCKTMKCNQKINQKTFNHPVQLTFDSFI